MVWPTALIVLGVLITNTIGQAAYRAYNGPPVVPVILPGGFLADTKEVADAKQYFLNALAKTAAEVKDESSTETYNTRTYQAPQPQQLYQQSADSQYQRHTQQAAPAFQPQPQHFTQPQIQSGVLYHRQPAYSTTPVKENRNYDNNFREQQQYQYISSSPRPDPQVTPVILDNGYIADTQEVNAAKADHFAAVARAQEAVARAQERMKAAGYPSAQPRF